MVALCNVPFPHDVFVCAFHFSRWQCSDWRHLGCQISTMATSDADIYQRMKGHALTGAQEELKEIFGENFPFSEPASMTFHELGISDESEDDNC